MADPKELAVQVQEEYTGTESTHNVSINDRNSNTCTVSGIEINKSVKKLTSSSKEPAPTTTSAVTFLAGDACRYPVVRAAAAKMGWKLITPESSSSSSLSKSKSNSSRVGKSQQQLNRTNCNVLWVDISILHDFFFVIQPWQCINHFPGMCNIARKTRLAQNLEAMKQRFPKEYNFYPQTFSLPKDFAALGRHFGSESGRKSKYTWIIKPDGGAKGKGIFLTRDMTDIQYAIRSSGCSYVAQRYITRPCLIDGKKFDLRLYVLVTSCDPLRVYLFRDGLCRLCTVDFVKPNGKNLKDRCAHLTNYSINKRSDAFQRDEACTIDDDTGDICSGGDSGSKRSVKWLLSWLRSKHGDEVVDRLWCRIGDICVKTIVSILPTLVSEYRATFAPTAAEESGNGPGAAKSSQGEVEGSRCFEILGFDVMLDENLRPHLIEVNHLPSFGTDAPIDRAIKSKVIEQAMGIVRAKANDRTVYERSQRKSSRHRLVNRRSSTLGDGEPCEDDDDKDVAETKQNDHIGTTVHRHAPLPTAESILTAIYTEHAPEKLEKIPSMLSKYRGYEEWLVAKARERYCNPRASSEEDSGDEDSACGLNEVCGGGTHQSNGDGDDDDYDFSVADTQCEAEDSILKDYDRVYPPTRGPRPLALPPYKAMEEHAFCENAKQTERLTVPLYHSRPGENDQNGGDTLKALGNHQLINSGPSRGDSWVSGSLHSRRASLPTKIRCPPTQKQLQSFDRLSRGRHAKENADDNALGEGDGGRDLDPFNIALERSRMEVSVLVKKRWNHVKRARRELNEVRERRQRNQDGLDRGRVTLALQSIGDFDLGGNTRF